MSHPSDGALRLLHDEPQAVPEWVRRHEGACSRCRVRAQSIAADAAWTAQRLGGPTRDADVAAGWVRFRAAAPASAPAPLWTRLAERLRAGSPLGKPSLALGVSALLALLVAATVAAGPALFTIFQPQQVQTITVTAQELQGLPNLSSYGTMTSGPRPQLHTVATLAAAEQATGLHALVAHSLPAGLPRPPAYYVSNSSWRSFTFSAAKAAAAAAANHEPLRPMPADINGSTLVVSFGPALAQVYGNVDETSGPSGEVAAVVEMRSPRVSSSGVTVRQLEAYLLSQPGVSPELAAQIRAIGDPTSTLPVPIVAGRSSGQSVTVQGVNGVLLGDSTGLGAGVIWVKHGVVYGVVGTLTQAQVLEIANSLS